MSRFLVKALPLFSIVSLAAAAACSDGGSKSESAGSAAASLDTPPRPMGPNTVCGSMDVPMQRRDIARSGTTCDPYLTPSDVAAPGSFGWQFDRQVDGQIYAQPLYLSAVPTTEGAGGPIATHNVVYVATMN